MKSLRRLTRSTNCALAPYIRRSQHLPARYIYTMRSEDDDNGSLFGVSCGKPYADSQHAGRDAARVLACSYLRGTVRLPYRSKPKVWGKDGQRSRTRALRVNGYSSQPPCSHRALPLRDHDVCRVRYPQRALPLVLSPPLAPGASHTQPPGASTPPSAGVSSWFSCMRSSRHASPL